MTQSVSFHNLTPTSFLDRSAFVYPDKTAVVYKDKRYTYAQFNDRVNKLAGALKSAGIGRGDRVAFLVPNIPPMLEAHYGPMRIAAVLVAINIRLSPREIAYILNHSGARAMVFDSEFASTIRAVKDQVPNVNTWVQVVDEFPKADDIAGPDYESFLASAPPGEHRVELASEL
ncbi:MAG: AMP-binding protein, partial [SAR202 cluster bacterium]|nr:AMP-binding protein [SAR202 cluster bacterium]